jgi:hypothetical protein
MTPGQEEESVVAVYGTHAAAESAVKAVQQAGIDMRKLSIVGKGFHTEEHALGFYSAGDRMRFWGGRGAFFGSLWGMLFGNALFLIPGLGPLVVMGPLVGWIAGVLEGAAVGGAAGVLAAGLASIGIPADSVVKYDLEVKAGRFLVLAHGSTDLVDRAREVLLTTGASQVTAHAHPAAGDERRAEHITREAILGLLSDEEVARVSNAEASAQLSEGEEYLDLEQLDQGVRRNLRAPKLMGRVLPRRAVQERTWNEIVARLPAPSRASHPGV